MKPYIRFIGDVHGHIHYNNAPCYSRLIKKCTYSVQVGDFGFDYKYLDNVDHNYHVIVPGNHDNYNEIYKHPHFLSPSGIHTIPLPTLFSAQSFSFFYIRGAYSIDRSWRIKNVSWWPQEELNYVQSLNALNDYTAAKPSIVVSHDGPQEAINIINPIITEHSNTRRLLSECFAVHQPNIWIFGHHHKQIKFEYRNTLFISLCELGIQDFDQYGELLA